VYTADLGAAVTYALLTLRSRNGTPALDPPPPVAHAAGDDDVGFGDNGHVSLAFVNSSSNLPAVSFIRLPEEVLFELEDFRLLRSEAEPNLSIVDHLH
jgi:hypothetical protein